jgi:FKBP-type peptidyl-prolyl cis-trans isomerase SlyD
MKIGNKKVVTITYKLQEDDSTGLIIQEVDTKEPFVFLFGNQQVLPDFEVHLKDKSISDKFDFSIKCDDAYGPIDEKAVAELPRNLFEHEGNLGEMVKVGNFVPMKDQEGNSLQGLVIEINEEHVKMDFNHPLAGKNLYFSGEVVDVRDATEEEMEHGHVHGPGGHEH